LPRRLAAQVPPAPAARRFSPPTVTDATRRVLVLQGCVQQVATPEVNERLVELLATRGVQVTAAPDEGCCGSLGLHLGETAQARATMMQNVDALTRAIAGGTAGAAEDAMATQGSADVEAILSTASGCGVTVREYGRLFADDPAHYHAAQRLADMTLDASEFLHRLDTQWRRRGHYRKVAWHAPCTLQHGQQVRGHVEALLGAAGYELVAVTDAHLCCGSAGTYAILQPSLAERLKTEKVAALEREGPDVIATANIGCQLHLASAAGVPVVHWLELLE
jgi:glycolate oxidase iron-sulfur subunit